MEITNYTFVCVKDSKGNITRRILGECSEGFLCITPNITEDHIDYSKGEGYVLTVLGTVCYVSGYKRILSKEAEKFLRNFLLTHNLTQVCSECMSDPHKMGCGSKYGTSDSF